VFPIVNGRRAKEGCRDEQIDGPSCGLALLLGLASAVFRQPLPAELAALAGVTVHRKLAPVGEIARKIKAIAARARCVRTVLVHQDNLEQAQAAARSTPLAIVPVDTPGRAITLAFGQGTMHSLLGAAGREPARRQELVESFFMLAMRGRQATVDWTPIEAAAGLALSSWTELGPTEREKLDFARNVAARHRANKGLLTLPSVQWLSSLQRSVATEYLAHVGQQCADSGTPPLADVLDLVRPRIVTDDPDPATLKLLGAVGRLLAVTGEPEQGLELELKAAREWTARRDGQEASYPLCACFRIAAALGLAAALQETEQHLATLRAVVGISPAGRPYLDLARAAARIACSLDGRLIEGAEQQEALLCLQRLATLADRCPPHLRWSAARWLFEAFLAQGAAEQTAALARQVEEAAQDRRPGAPDDSEEQHSARVAWALIRLRQGQATGNPVQRQQALDDLRHDEEGIFDHLQAAAGQRGEELASYVLRFYPY